VLDRTWQIYENQPMRPVVGQNLFVLVLVLRLHAQPAPV
jgi:hypothetical protein